MSSNDLESRVMEMERRQHQTDQTIASILDILLQVSSRLDRITALQEANAEQIERIWGIIETQTGNGHGG